MFIPRKCRNSWNGWKQSYTWFGTSKIECAYVIERACVIVNAMVISSGHGLHTHELCILGTEFIKFWETWKCGNFFSKTLNESSSEWIGRVARSAFRNEMNEWELIRGLHHETSRKPRKEHHHDTTKI